MIRRKFPVGIEDFAKLRTEDFYYIDKTGMIRELLQNWGEVNMFTRPRRFGKSLTMSMLKSFFEVGSDRSLFDGLDISGDEELCREYMGKFPVISISLKNVRGATYDEAIRQMWSVVRAEAERFDYLQDSEKLNERDRRNMMDLSCGIGNLEESLLLMSRILRREYGRKVIILIDEYDAPLEKAEGRGFYREMADFISQFFSYGMKTNENMKFAVVTGCLRVAKESIFTGFNNPKIHTIIDEEYDEWFGFTDAEVRRLLDDYGLSEFYDLTREWYDGYLFGRIHVYCPWDVINWCEQLANTSDHFPRNYWTNTSDNAMITRFADLADARTRDELGSLLEGGTVSKKLRLDLNYSELDKNVDNLWSVLFTTGYLTHRGRDADGRFELILPNREIADIFRMKVDDWFREKVLSDEDGLRGFFEAISEGNADALEECLNEYMMESVSYLDGGKTQDKENFYHGLLMGMFGSRRGWDVWSNREGGEGCPDIAAVHRREKIAVIMEIKVTQDERELKEKAESALEQIRNGKYDLFFGRRKPERITHYGIAFCKKECRVVKE